VRLIKNEYPLMFQSSLSEMTEILNIDRNLVQCSYNNLLLHDIEFALGIQQSSQEIILPRGEEGHHPGSRDILIKYGLITNKEEPKNLDGCKRFLAALLQKRKNANLEEVDAVLKFLLENAVENHILSGPMVEECNKWLQKWGQEVIIQDSELAMDVLQVVSNPIVGKNFGTSAANSCTSTSALAITSMVLKDDYKMFFGDDTSTYVSLFCDLADTMVKMADSSNQEISRLHTGDALLHLAEFFNQRVLLPETDKSELSIHMRYGLVQVMNAALILLDDENCDVRMKALAFVSRLCCHRREGHHENDDEGPPQPLQHGLSLSRGSRQCRKLSRVYAIKALTLIGLDFFEDCAEYFLVLSKLSNVNWTLSFTPRFSTTSQLFEIGSGVNVFAEEAYVAGLYFKILMTWLASEDNRKPEFKFLNCPNILEKATRICQDLSLHQSLDDHLFGPGVVSTPQGYTNTIQIYYFLKIIASYPILATEDLSPDDCQKLNDVCESLGKAIKI